jgi:DNA-binding PadR family transcriptional regulator
MPNGQATPVQVVKMLFLMEKKIPSQIGDAKFNFVPYDYGPFDPTVYSELRILQRDGLLDVMDTKPRLYRLTPLGHRESAQLMQRIDAGVATYLRNLGMWMSGISFAQLVTAIYREFPEMRANSVFRG